MPLMANDFRVPPAVSLTFEKAATDICNRAKLDYDEWPLQAHEFVTHLQERWKEGIEKGLTTEDAEARALALFGDPAATAKALRKPWLRRVLSYERYRPERHLLFLVAYVFHAWLTVLDVHYRTFYNHQNPDLNTILLPFQLRFFVDGLGMFFVGLTGVAAVMLIQWLPKTWNAWVYSALCLKGVLWSVVIFAACILLTKPSYWAYETFRLYENYFFYQGFCVLHLLAIPLAWLGAACLISEACNYPGLVKKRLRKNKPFGVIS